MLCTMLPLVKENSFGVLKDVTVSMFGISIVADRRAAETAAR